MDGYSSAFPAPASVGPNGEIYSFASTGMTLRAYLMAHAPAEPQPWFEPKMPPRPALGKWIDAEDGRVYGTYADAVNVGVVDFVINEASDSLIEWENERKKQRYLQWPAAWADEILKQP